MKTYTTLLLIYLIFIPLELWAKDDKQVLFISSYNSRFPTYFQQIDGIKSILDTAGIKIDIEFLDSKRFTNDTSLVLFYQSLKHKLKNHSKYDAILTADDDAFNFTRHHHEELFKDIPTVFFGVNNIDKALEQNQNPNITGVVEAISMQETIELMILLFPETKQLYCITDGTSSGKADLELYHQIAKQNSTVQFKEIDLAQLSFNAYISALASIQERTPVLLLSAYTDKTGKSIDFAQSMHLLNHNLHAPLFHLWEHGLGDGVFGGKIISHYKQAQMAASMVYDIVNQEAVSNIKVNSQSPNVFMFDYNQLLKYKITLEQLPAHSIIINQPFTFWSKYKKQLLISLSIFVFLCFTIIYLTITILKRLKAEKQLKSQNNNIRILNRDLIKAKQILEEEEQKFKQLFYDHSAVKLLINGTTGQIYDVNPAAATFYGWSTEELIGMNINKINTLPPSKIKERMESAKNKGKAHFEFKHRKADGTTVDVEVFSNSITISGEKYLYSIVHDVSEKKKHEHRLHLLSRSVEQSPVGIIITDKEGAIEYINPAFTKMSGFAYQEVIGKNPQTFIANESLDHINASILDTIRTGHTWLGEMKNIKASGDYYWVSVAISPILENQTVCNYVIICEDITEQRQTFKDLVESKEKANQSDRLKSAFLANMSHEIRTPMNGILGFTELLNKPNLANDVQQKYIAIIKKSGIRMLNIINQIIDFSKIESGLMKIELKESNYVELIEYTYTFFKPEAENKGLQFTINNPLDDQDLIINTDREKVYAILSNLVKNAIKYTKEGSIEIGYHLNKNKSPYELESYVKDTGIGIPKDRQGAIFERFVQADIEDRMAYQGAGLGLSITKAYVEMLGGVIGVKSIEGEGSTFYFTLPYTSSDNITKDNEQATAVIKNHTMKKLKILLAEDDEISALLMDEMLNEYSSEILKAKTGIEAIELCQEHPDIDLVLMDIRMPEMGGYRATKHIREFNKELIIIAQTAYGLSGDKEKAIAAGCNDHISKPINKLELSKLIEKYFN